MEDCIWSGTFGIWSMGSEACSTDYGVRSIEYLSRSMKYRVWKIGYGIWTVAYGILNMGYRMWSVECGMDSVGDYCSKLSRCIFDVQVVGDIWDADRIEGRASAWPEVSGVPWSLGTRAPSNLHGEPGCFFAGLEFAYKPKTQRERPESENVVKKISKCRLSIQTLLRSS